MPVPRHTLEVMADEADWRAWPETPWVGRGSPAAALRRLIAPAATLGGLGYTLREVWPAYGGAARAGVLACAVVIAVGFLGVLAIGGRLSRPARVALVAVQYAAAVAFPLIVGDVRGLGLAAYPLLAGIVALPPLWIRVAGAATAVVVVALSWWQVGTPSWDIALMLAFVAFMITGVRQLNRTVAALRVARDEIAELSAAAERARLARDLHDVLGHSLTTITVKTGLARRFLESGAHGDRALAEVRDAERLSRHTLEEIRATVSGYRRASLTAELAGARSALRGAGIAARLPQSSDEVRADLREPFAYVLREGITNVIRHSGATTCEVRLGPDWIEVRDDGSGGAPVPGTGLTGLSERMTESGARLSAGPTSGGFHLTATAAPAALNGPVTNDSPAASSPVRGSGADGVPAPGRAETPAVIPDPPAGSGL